MVMLMRWTSSSIINISEFPLEELRPSLGQWAPCGPVEGFVRPSLGFHCRMSNSWQSFFILILIIWHFSCSGPQCHFITSVLRTGRFPRVHWHLGPKRISSSLISTLVSLALNSPMISHLRSLFKGTKQSLALQIARRLRTLQQLSKLKWNF